MSFTLPDLRFEQTFYKQLLANAGKKYPEGNSLSDKELKLLSKKIDEEEERIRDSGDTHHHPGSQNNQLQPIEPITPWIVIYTIIKDQMFFPLLQGFLWTGVLISLRPLMRLAVKQGQHAGTWVANLVGLNAIHRR